MSETSQSQNCGKCGAALSGYASDGLCAACLLESAFEDVDAAAGKTSITAPLLAFHDYEILEEIARGGMGVVYRARQISLNRPVAIKMILGGHLANTAELKRFRAEAETAAQLQHPNIVAIHEVGEHAGQPFFSMDLVEGRNLARLVRDDPLPSRKAASYLKTIAEAIQYAHSRGVLHRDLKPSNILIDEHDQPRITDFGLAKRLDSQPLTNDLQLTQTGQVLGSPSFIPPEQAGGQKDAIGPASDVYSLGAILYHCLTARPPFVADSLPQTLRLVAEQEPVSPRLLNAGVPRDLDTICLKCLEKDSSHRYDSAQDLADDLGRFLRNEPIQARPLGVVLKVHRWCLRNKALAASGTAALALLLVVAIGSPIAAVRIVQERGRAVAASEKARDALKQANDALKQAKTEAAKSLQVARFLQDMLKSVGPSVALGRDATLLKEILDQTMSRVGNDLEGEPEVEAELRTTIGQVYMELAEFEKAEANYSEALAIRRRIFVGQHPSVAVSLNFLGGVLWRQGKLDEARVAHEEALAIRQHVFGFEDLAVAESLDSLAGVLWRQGKLALAEEKQRAALAIQQRRLTAGKPTVAVANALDNLAAIIWTQHKLDEAEIRANEALKMRVEMFTRKHPDVAVSLNNLANILRDKGQLAEAANLHREALAMRREFYHPEHVHVATSLANLALVLLRQNELAEAETVIRECLRIYEKKFTTDWRRFSAQSLLGGILFRQGHHAAAESLLLTSVEEMLQRKETIPSDSTARLREGIQYLVQLYEATRRHDQAAEWEMRLVDL